LHLKQIRSDEDLLPSSFYDSELSTLKDIAFGTEVNDCVEHLEGWKPKLEGNQIKQMNENKQTKDFNLPFGLKSYKGAITVGWRTPWMG
jgi:hypothetical protein